MVAPSFVTITSWPLPMLCKILSCKHTQRPTCFRGHSRRMGLHPPKCTSSVCRIQLNMKLTMPLGPSVVFTRSAMAIAPMNAACRGTALAWGLYEAPTC